MIIIDGNSLPDDPSTGCLVSIFTAGFNSKSLPWPVRSVQETYPQIFFDVERERHELHGHDRIITLTDMRVKLAIAAVANVAQFNRHARRSQSP